MSHTCLPDTEHVELPDEQWADLRRRLTHGQAQQVEQAQLEADYDTKGELAMAVALAQSALSGAPKEWRDAHYDETTSTIRFALESYETSMEAAVSSPEKRKQMAQATLALNETFVRVYVAAWSYGEPIDLDSADAGGVRLIARRAQRSWNAWQREMRDRLKDDGEPAADGIPLDFDAEFLIAFPGWSPRDLADADPELVELMVEKRSLQRKAKAR